MPFVTPFLLLVMAAALVVIAVSLWKIMLRIHAHLVWDKKKFSQEFMSRFIYGEFPDLRERLERVQDCHISNEDETYDLKAASCSKERMDEINRLLKNILNIMEGLCINIKFGIVDEDVSYNYLGWLVPQYHRWSKQYIEDLRNRANDPFIYIHISEYAERWSTRMKEESREKSAP